MATFIAAAIILAVGVLGMCVAIIFKKDGHFPEYDVGSNKKMHEMGIRCYKDEDAAMHKRKCSGNDSAACKDCALRKEQIWH